MMKERILIAGCGRLGTRLGRELAAAGHRVFGLRRRCHELPAVIDPCPADLASAGDLSQRLPDRLDRIYFIMTPDQYDDAGYRAAYVTSLGHLLGALPDRYSRAARLIMVSSTGVYGQDDGSWVDEASPTRPARFSGVRLLEAEALAHGHGGPSTVIRFGGIYGPGREGLLRKVRRGDACQARPPRYTNRIHEDDCIGVLGHFGGLPDPPPVVIGVDDDPATQCEVMNWLASQIGWPAPAQSNGDGAGRRCSNRLLRRSGYELRYPDFRAGYSALLTASR
jgi:nucleoside-diphosphate-sugar epimerase